MSKGLLPSSVIRLPEDALLFILQTKQKKEDVPSSLEEAKEANSLPPQESPKSSESPGTYAGLEKILSIYESANHSISDSYEKRDLNNVSDNGFLLSPASPERTPPLMHLTTMEERISNTQVTAELLRKVFDDVRLKVKVSPAKTYEKMLLSALKNSDLSAAVQNIDAAVEDEEDEEKEDSASSCDESRGKDEEEEEEDPSGGGKMLGECYGTCCRVLGAQPLPFILQRLNRMVDDANPPKLVDLNDFNTKEEDLLLAYSSSWCFSKTEEDAVMVKVRKSQRFDFSGEEELSRIETFAPLLGVLQSFPRSILVLSFAGCQLRDEGAALLLLLCEAHLHFLEILDLRDNEDISEIKNGSRVLSLVTNRKNIMYIYLQNTSLNPSTKAHAKVLTRRNRVLRLRK